MWNLIGVLTSSGAVAYSVITLLPVELILQVSSGAGFAMVFALLIAAIIWNLSTWALGLPASSSHTMVGSIIGVGIANQLMAGNNGTAGVDWEQVSKVFKVLLISPVVGFGVAWLLMLVTKKLVKYPALFQAPKGEEPPPFLIRALLVLTCTGVSFGHGSNDGQKGMGLIMLILIGTVPTAYALNHAVGTQDVIGFVAVSDQVAGVLSNHVDKDAVMGDPRADVTEFLKSKHYTPNTTVALRELVEDVCGMFAQQAHGKGLEITCLLPHTLPIALRGDPMRLRQVITNIVGNAVKFTTAGEVSVRVGLVDEDDRRARLHFEVSDTGIGIPVDKQDRIFEAFSQADSSTTRSFGGTGLGLAISKQLVDLMGGHLQVRSTVGEGATFWFEVDVIKQSASARRVFSGDGRLNGLRVLVVDDNATNREILEEQTAAWNVQCTSCAGAREAMALMEAAFARGEPFEVVVLDLHMPDIDGLELARTIKSTPAFAATPLIMLSSATLRDGAQAVPQGLIRCSLTKPVRQSDLFQAIATANEEGPAPAPAESTVEPPAVVARSGCRVLLAEDNLINQDVAKAMLEVIGARTTVVSDGRQVLEALAREPFDLILMDCQMPGMDGYEATARVRERERAGGGRIPIIALTANAVAGDAEHCIAAGMDDYLSKPFSQRELAELVTRWAPQAAAGGTPDRAAAAPPAPPDDAEPREASVNPRALESIRLLAAGLLERVVRQYIVDAPRYLGQMRTALDAGEPETLRRAAHALKSSSANLGAERFAALCQALETLGRAGTTQGGAPRLADAEREYARVCAALSEAVAPAAQREA